MKVTSPIITLWLTACFMVCGCIAFSQTSQCGNVAPGSISFNPGSSKITPAAQSALDELAVQMRAFPNCRVIVVSTSGGSKVEESRGVENMSAVIEYMSEKNNIYRNRFKSQIDGGSAANTVNYHPATASEDAGWER